MAKQATSIWDYYTKVKDNVKKAFCNQCFKEISYKTSITNLKIHLKHKHRGHYNSLMAESKPDAYVICTKCIVPPSNEQGPDAQPSTSTHEEFRTELHQLQNTGKTESQPKTSIFARIKPPLRTEDNKYIDAMLLKLMAKTYQPFSIVEEPDFVEFVKALNPHYILPARKVISEGLIPFLYSSCMEEQKKILHEAETVCLTTDTWNSIKMDAFIGITAHYINKDFEFRTVVLKCSVINVLHTSQNLASILKKTSEEWDLQNKINLCVTDNAANIVGAIDILGWKHCGCIAHKLNLILLNSLKLIDGIINKVKRIVSHYRSSYKAKEKLLQYQTMVPSQPLVLINSVPTRWNSTYFMIQRFVVLQDSVRATTPNLDTDLPIITGEEWIVLKQMCKVLEPFDEATRELSDENYVCASKAIPVINGLKDVLQELKKKPEYYDSIKDVIQNIESQLNSHFLGIECEENLALCTILDPRFKLSMFIHETAAESAKSNLLIEVKNLMRQTPSDTPVETLPTDNRTDDGEMSIWRKRNIILKERKMNSVQNITNQAQQEVESYLLDAFADSKCDPCQWWRSSQYKFPHIAKLFQLNCNTVATSVPSDHLFSKAGYTLSERKTRLSGRKTEQLVFLNANLKNGDYVKLMP